MCACDVFRFLRHLEQYPPADVILAAVHLKPRPQKMTKPPDLDEVAPFLGAKQPMPSAMRAMYEAAVKKFEGGSLAEKR